MIKIALEGSPLSTQTIYGLSNKGRYTTRFLTAPAKKLKSSYIKQVREQYKGEMIESRVKIKVDLYFKNFIRRDWDNYHKLSIDALEDWVIKDDCQIYEAIVCKHIDKDYVPHIEIEIETLE